MKTIRYKGHSITVTTSDTTVHGPMPGGRTGHYQQVRPLIRIEGEAAKEEGRRPFITTIQQAKQHINDNIKGG